jgi:hypothetical protein
MVHGMNAVIKLFYPQNLWNSPQLYHFWHWYYSSQFLVEIKDTSSNGSAAYAYTDFDDKNCSYNYVWVLMESQFTSQMYLTTLLD